ncbi:hypothetical protein, partial [Thomasclavelia ramosa]|uniref:hypothetical protein n=1 Tax=Thomasclavelia ramosa TaxID=1547 RepID=UPI001D024614
FSPVFRLFYPMFIDVQRQKIYYGCIRGVFALWHPITPEKKVFSLFNRISAFCTEARISYNVDC